MIQRNTKAIRSLPEVHTIKTLTPIGCENAIQLEDDVMFKQIIMLTTVQYRRLATELNEHRRRCCISYTKHYVMGLNKPGNTRNSFESAYQWSANRIL